MRATSYIVTYRATDDPARRANLEATLRWLKLQPLAEVIVVEQDEAPTLGDFESFPALRSLFAYNPGPFNKSWGFNIGAPVPAPVPCSPLATWTSSAGRCRRRETPRGPTRRWFARFRSSSISTASSWTCCARTCPALTTRASALRRPIAGNRVNSLPFAGAWCGSACSVPDAARRLG